MIALRHMMVQYKVYTFTQQNQHGYSVSLLLISSYCFSSLSWMAFDSDYIRMHPMAYISHTKIWSCFASVFTHCKYKEKKWMNDKVMNYTKQNPQNLGFPLCLAHTMGKLLFQHHCLCYRQLNVCVWNSTPCSLLIETLDLSIQHQVTW